MNIEEKIQMLKNKYEKSKHHLVFGESFEKGDAHIVPIAKVSFHRGHCGKKDRCMHGLGVSIKTKSAGYISEKDGDAKFVCEPLEKKYIALIAGMAAVASLVLLKSLKALRRSR